MKKKDINLHIKDNQTRNIFTEIEGKKRVLTGEKWNGKVSLGIGIVLGVALISLLMLFYGYGNTWKLWNVSPMSPCFADFRTIPGGIESQSMGYDPLVKNPGDPWGREMNYPRIWLMLLAGINQSHVVYFGIAIAILFIIGIFLYMPRIISKIAALILMAAIFSPAVLLGVERGNIDLVIFFLLSVAILYINKGSIIAKFIATTSFLAAFILKLFPIFGIGLIFSQKKQSVIRLGLFLLGCAIIYIVVTYKDLMLISRGTPRETFVSYGIDVLWMNMNDHSIIFGQIIKALSYASVLICLVAVPYWACSKDIGSTENIQDDKRSIDAFRVGSGIYIGTFLLENNFDYRLVFLLFVIPQLMLWSSFSSKPISMISKSTIAGIMFSMWTLVIYHLMIILHFSYALYSFLDGVSSWVIFYGLYFLFFFSLPAWIKAATKNAFSLTWLQPAQKM